MALSPMQPARLFGGDITASVTNTPRRLFGGDITADITNTPPPQERNRPAFTPQPVRNEGGSSPTATAKVQRFSLRSRSARLRGSKVGTDKSARRLQVPDHLSSGVAQSVKICDCTADPCLGAGRRRLCKRATDDHEEFRLLELLNGRFIRDCRSGGELIATKVCMSKMDTYFILEPSSDAVMGYAAIVPDFDHGILPGSGGFCLSDDLARFIAKTFSSLPLLSQLYVEPHARKQGLATAALRVLLASHTAVVVDSPSLATAKTMLRLGFKPVGAQSSGRVAVLYVRVEALVAGMGADENA